MHFGRKPRAANTNMIGQPQCFLSNWKKTVTKNILAKRTELLVFTIHDSDREIADYLKADRRQERYRPESSKFKKYQFYEQQDKPISMKCSFKTNKTLTAVGETDDTVTTADGKITRKKLASFPLKFQPQKKSEEARKPTNWCRRCGKFSQGDLCETHRRLMGEMLKQDETSTSKSSPKMPNRETEERTVITITTDSQTTDGEGDSIAAVENTEADEVTEIRAPPSTTITCRTLTAETPIPSSPIGCSTEISTSTNGRDLTATPTRPSDTITESPEGGKVCGSEGVG